MIRTTERSLDCNGLRTHIDEAGEGPLVILCHGFPEVARTWRHQLPALASAGWHAVAPDLRGYGRTDCPEGIDAYSIFEMVGDMVALVQTLGHHKTVIIGHDVGARIAQFAAVLRPDVFRAVALLSVPFAARQWGGLPPTVAMQLDNPGKVLHHIYFQEPGKAEAELGADVRGSLLGIMHTFSGTTAPEGRRLMLEPGEKLRELFVAPNALPDWLEQEHLDHLTKEFTRTGFRGGLNFYRNMDFHWAQTRWLLGARIHQPSLFIAGAAEPPMQVRMKLYEELEQSMPGLTRKLLLTDIGHWQAEEAPQAVNELLLEFLSPLRATI